MSVTRKHQSIPITLPTDVLVASVAATGDPGTDGTEIPYSFLVDENNPTAKVPIATVAQDGTDPVGTNAGVQAGSTTVGVGIRGWLSTLVGLFQTGLARVTIQSSTLSPVFTNPRLMNPPTSISAGDVVANREIANTAANYGQITVLNTPTVVRLSTAGRNVCFVRNISGTTGQDIYVGSDNLVTTSNGMLMRASAFDGFDVKWTGPIYAVVATGTGTLNYWEEVV